MLALAKKMFLLSGLDLIRSPVSRDFPLELGISALITADERLLLCCSKSTLVSSASARTDLSQDGGLSFLLEG